MHLQTYSCYANSCGLTFPKWSYVTPPTKKKQLVKNCRDLSGDMYVLLAGEVDIETDLGVAQAPFWKLG